MIGFLSGEPRVIGAQLLVVTNGVGYQVVVGQRVLAEARHSPHVELYIHTHVREEALELYGFADLSDKHLFLLLLNISGVGPRTALAISELGNAAIHTAVQEANIALLTAVPRVGKKLAQKIIIELKSKMGSIKELDLSEPSQQQQELIQALTGLGFAESTVLDAIRVAQVDDMMVEQALPKVLKLLQK